MTGPTPPTARPTAASLWVIAGMLLAAVAVRLIPHPPNFTPVGAMALFAGAMLRDKRLAMLLPLAALLVSDMLIGRIYGPGFGLHRSQLFVYGAFLLITLLGRTLQDRRRNPLRIVTASLTASLLFFVVTNLGVWLTSGMYALTPGELVRCFVQAIPFFGNTLTGDLTFVAVFFGGYALLEKFVTGDQPAALLGDDA